MRLAVFSDLHIEFGPTPNLACESVDVIILAGDCHSPQGLVKFARSLYEQYKVPVICVAGNHEHYNGSYEETLEFLGRELAASGVHFLENEALTLGGVRFLGCTLWSNFMLYGGDEQPAVMKVVDDCITDFWAIRYEGRRFAPADAERLCLQSLQWLEQELAKPFSGKTVVVTHFAPHAAARHHGHAQGDPITPYFITDCSYLLERYDIDAWLYGHTHNSVDVQVGVKTRLLSNQKGYPNEDAAYTGFRRDLAIEV